MSKKKKSKKLKKAAKANLAKLDKQLLSASDALLTLSIETGKKWHKLFKKSITVSEPIRGKQIDMFFDTTDAVRDQIEESAVRFKKLLGIEENIAEIIQKKINKNKVVKQLAENASKLVSIVNDGELKQSIEQAAVKIKMEITEKRRGKKKAKKKSDKKKSKEKKTAGTKAKVKTAKKTEKAKVKKTMTKSVKRGPNTGAKRKTTALEKAIAQPAKKRGRPAGTTAKIVTTTGAKRRPKPAAKPTTVKKVAAKSSTTKGKRGRKPKPGRPGFDDLKKVIGIGAKMELILNAKGVKTYKDLKSISVRDLQGIINSAGGYYQSYKPQLWKAEAALAAAGKFDQMKTGRR